MQARDCCYFFTMPVAACCMAFTIGWPQFAMVQSPEAEETLSLELPPLEGAVVVPWVMTFVPSGAVTQMTFA